MIEMQLSSLIKLSNDNNKYTLFTKGMAVQFLGLEDQVYHDTLSSAEAVLDRRDATIDAESLLFSLRSTESRSRQDCYIQRSVFQLSICSAASHSAR
jgi:hypothetical protein